MPAPGCGLSPRLSGSPRGAPGGCGRGAEWRLGLPNARAQVWTCRRRAGLPDRPRGGRGGGDVGLGTCRALRAASARPASRIGSRCPAGLHQALPRRRGGSGWPRAGECPAGAEKREVRRGRAGAPSESAGRGGPRAPGPGRRWWSPNSVQPASPSPSSVEKFDVEAASRARDCGEAPSERRTRVSGWSPEALAQEGRGLFPGPEPIRGGLWTVGEPRLRPSRRFPKTPGFQVHAHRLRAERAPGCVSGALRSPHGRGLVNGEGRRGVCLHLYKLPVCASLPPKFRSLLYFHARTIIEHKEVIS